MLFIRAGCVSIDNSVVEVYAAAWCPWTRQVFEKVVVATEELPSLNARQVNVLKPRSIMALHTFNGFINPEEDLVGTRTGKGVLTAGSRQNGLFTHERACGAIASLEGEDRTGLAICKTANALEIPDTSGALIAKAVDLPTTGAPQAAGIVPGAVSTALSALLGAARNLRTKRGNPVQVAESPTEASGFTVAAFYRADTDSETQLTEAPVAVVTFAATSAHGES